MKILFIANGSSAHATRWANGLSAKGYEIIFVCVRRGKQPLDSSVKKIDLKYGHPFGYILNLFQIKRILKKKQPDVLHIHYAVGNAILGILSSYKPMITSLYGSDILLFPQKSIFHKRLMINILKKSTLICSTSNVMKVAAEHLLSKEQLNIPVTPFGVDVEFFKKTSMTKEKDKIVIGTVKKIEPIYGIDVLVNSFKLLLEDNEIGPFKNSLELVIVGEGSHKKKIELLVDSLGLKKKIRLVGRIPHKEVPEFLNQFDIFAALSRSESFGVSVIEASACEVPVVVSNVGGLPEVVDNEITGYVVESENIYETKEAFKKLVTNPSRRRDFGRNGRQKVIEKFIWEKNLMQMEEIYKSVV